MTHTPGTWMVVKVNDGFVIKQKELHDKGFSDLIAECFHYREKESNAKLIAAAPDMLEALKELIKQLGGASAKTINQKEAIKAAKKIIIKATL